MKLYKLVKTKWHLVEGEFNEMLKIGSVVSFHFVGITEEAVGVLFELEIKLDYAVGDMVKANAPGFSENGTPGVVKAINDGGLVDVYYPAGRYLHALDTRIYYNYLSKVN